MLFFLKMNDKVGKRKHEPQLLLCIGTVLPVSRSTLASRSSSSMGGSFRKAGSPGCSRIRPHPAPPPPCAGGASSSTGPLLLISKHSKTLVPSQKPRRDPVPAPWPLLPSPPAFFSATRCLCLWPSPALPIPSSPAKQLLLCPVASRCLLPEASCCSECGTWAPFPSGSACSQGNTAQSQRFTSYHTPSKLRPPAPRGLGALGLRFHLFAG